MCSIQYYGLIVYIYITNLKCLHFKYYDEYLILLPVYYVDGNYIDYLSIN